MLWLWLAAIAPMRTLAWEPPYSTGVPLKRQKDQKKTKKTNKKKVKAEKPVRKPFQYSRRDYGRLQQIEGSADFEK